MATAPFFLDPSHVAALESALHDGSAVASNALATWIGKPSVVELDSLEQLALQDATGIVAAELGTGEDDSVCACCSAIQGALAGYLLLCFNDADGLALADLIEQVPVGTTRDWSELATSAALETANILGCSYLNSLWTHLVNPDDAGLLPTPPQFFRDYAASLMQFVLIDQASAGNQLIVARTRFEIDSSALNWLLLFVPDPASLEFLSRHLSVTTPPGGKG